MTSSETSWAEIKRRVKKRLEDPGIRVHNGLTGQPMQAGDMLHIDTSHIPLWIVNDQIWIDEEGCFVTPMPSFIHLPSPGCDQ